MISFQNILIPRVKSVYHLTSHSDAPTTCKYSYNIIEKENRHYSLTKRGPMLLEHQKKKCGNPLSVFVSFSRYDDINPTIVSAFFDTYGNLTPFWGGYYSDYTILSASRRLFCLLEIIEGINRISHLNVSKEDFNKQFSYCVELLFQYNQEEYLFSHNAPGFESDDSYLNDSIYRNCNGDIIIQTPTVAEYLNFICANYFESKNSSINAVSFSSFEVTKSRIALIENELQIANSLSDPEERSVYLEEHEYLPNIEEIKYFENIKICSSFACFFVDQYGHAYIEENTVPLTKEAIFSLKTLSKMVIDRELSFYVRPVRYIYSSVCEEAVPQFSCLHQLLYFSLIAMERNSVYVDCSKETCRNKTVKLFDDKIIPCCCTSCRTAAASKRNRERKNAKNKDLHTS